MSHRALGLQFNHYRVPDASGTGVDHDREYDWHVLDAHLEGQKVGHISWYPTGTVATVETHPDHQGKGVATAMFRKAQEIDPEVHHSDSQTTDGKLWASKVRD